jgi:hypothetical protein
MIKLLFIQSGRGPDYLSDLIFGELTTSGKFQIYTNVVPSYMYKDHLELAEVYGRGFTVFGKLDTTLKDRLTLLSFQESEELIRDKFFDLVVWGSIWRESGLLDEAFQVYGRGGCVVFDGEDHQLINQAYLKSVYFKRELIYKPSEFLRPVSFKFPSWNLINLTTSWEKDQLLADVIPYFERSYKYVNEVDYYRQYHRSIFGFTRKKGGWDCMRHYEIVSNFCLPFFPDINEKPPFTMHDWPLSLQIRANKLFLSILNDSRIVSRSGEAPFISLTGEFYGWLQASGKSSSYSNLIGGIL